ncbi:hypothetical protein [Sorangium sp. So ce131]|uniref:hypothetical protein n=1 Tax=Sorangium sp. So ce131 TaxID=3133282 RepID=UPI003F634123
MGAQIVLTGIRPDVVKALVAVEIELGGVTTRSALKDGILYAEGTLGRRRAAR